MNLKISYHSGGLSGRLKYQISNNDVGEIYNVAANWDMKYYIQNGSQLQQGVKYALNFIDVNYINTIESLLIGHVSCVGSKLTDQEYFCLEYSSEMHEKISIIDWSDKKIRPIFTDVHGRVLSIYGLTKITDSRSKNDIERAIKSNLITARKIRKIV